MDSFLTHLECTVCGDRHTPHEVQTVCRSCGRSLSAHYDLKSAKHLLTRDWFREQQGGLWSYGPVLPLSNPEHIVSLGEVQTPIFRIASLEKWLHGPKVWVKDEGHLPGGSFKSRGLSVAVSKARELGIREVCIPSAGNAAGALAAYAARAGIGSHIFIPRDTPDVNIQECIAFGGEVELVEGNISHAAKRMNERRKENPQWFDMSTLKEPYRLEGKKTMGYELAGQFEWQLPKMIVYPTGGGTGLIGMWKAFGEMEELGLIGEQRPKMVVVQSEGCAPIVSAFGKSERESEFWENAATIATGLRVPKAFADHLILAAVYESKGTAVAVSDAQILETMVDIAHKDGVFLCPEGAATVAALKNLPPDTLPASGDILLFNTAAGYKYPQVVPEFMRRH